MLDRQMINKIRHVYRIYNGRLYPFFDNLGANGDDFFYEIPPQSELARRHLSRGNLLNQRGKAKLKVSSNS